MSKVTWQEPWRTSVYEVQCKTFKVAQTITGIHGNVSKGTASFKPPYCLRIAKEYRDRQTKFFRGLVALEVRRLRLRGAL